jgi:hypothetical protein
MGYSNGMEMDMLYYEWSRIRAKWSTYGVSQASSNNTSKFSDGCHSWAHEICSDDNEERSLVIGSMNEMAYVFQAWLPLIVWQQVDAPKYQKGYITVTILSILLIVFTFIIRFLHQKEKLSKRSV